MQPKFSGKGCILAERDKKGLSINLRNHEIAIQLDSFTVPCCDTYKRIHVLAHLMQR